MGTLFGTDGIRGVAGELLTAEFATTVGRAAAVVLAQKTGHRPRFVIGRDTRLSGPMLEAALVAGITSGGGDAEIAGVIPTPGLAALVIERGADAGVVISASHNPFADNGIKFFSSAGLKLSDDEEAEIEEHVLHHDLRGATGAATSACVEPRARRRETRTSTACSRRLPVDLGGMRLAVDCAHGAMYARRRWRCAAPAPTSPCSAPRPTASTSTPAAAARTSAALQEMVRADDYDLGLAFDGDGDRVLAVDRHGNLVDGDFVIAILATPSQAARAPAARHGRHHGHDQPRLPPRHGARGHRRADHRRRRPLRGRRDAARRLRARRRAVRPHHQPRAGDHRRRAGHGAAAAAVAAADGAARCTRRPR